MTNADEGATQQKTPALGSHAASTAGTILVVEDNPLNAELVTDLLVAKGFQVRSTDTAEAAIVMARAILPALILMDINLPGMDGVSAAKILKQDPATCQLIIIGLTAEIDRSEMASFDGYLAKPIDVHTFAGSIQSFLSIHRPASGNRL